MSDAYTWQPGGMKKFSLPDIPESEQTPVVKGLLTLVELLIEENTALKERVEKLEDEVRVLKGQKKRPTFKPSALDKNTQTDDEKENTKKSHSGKKRGRANVTRPVDRNERVRPDNIPPGSTLHGIRPFHVQELIISSEHICYELERWKTPDGRIITARPPVSGHFGHQLITYVLYQHHHCQVTQPLLLEQLREWGVQISSGQLNRILLDDKDGFHEEKEALLGAALMHSDYITVDDSGARHQGKNGYVTHIGNAWFGWFCSTPSKNRINFLMLLNAGDVQYRISAQAITYMRQNKLPKVPLTQLSLSAAVSFAEQEAWLAYLESLNIKDKRHIRIATEGALVGHLLHKGQMDNLAIISDGAGQFAVFEHGLCWVHTERLIRNLLPLNEAHQREVDTVLAQVWDFYRQLKQYKEAPDPDKATMLSAQFDAIFTQKTNYITLNRKLRQILQHKAKLLLVLRHPEVPLHTNGSETDIRDYVKKRKVSGGTRSDEGRRCRDTFASLKKTCRKLEVSFWHYLKDRLTDNVLPPLSELMQNKMVAGQ